MKKKFEVENYTLLKDGEEGEDQYDDEKGEESREVGSFNNFIATREIKLNDKIKDSTKS